MPFSDSSKIAPHANDIEEFFFFYNSHIYITHITLRDSLRVIIHQLHRIRVCVCLFVCVNAIRYSDYLWEESVSGKAGA